MVKDYIKHFWKLMRSNEVLILPGHLAFFLILSLFPILSLVGLIASSLDISIDFVYDALNSVFPANISSVLVEFFTAGGGALNIMFLITGMYVSSKGFDAVIKASNLLYKFKNNFYLIRKIKALLLTILIMFLFMFSMVAITFGGSILQAVMNFTSFGEFIINNYNFLIIYKTALSFLIIFTNIKLIYTLAPSFRVNSKYTNNGAFVATILIMLFTNGFSFYLTNYASYDILYGNLAFLAALMLLVYFISYIFVLGIAINCNYYKFLKSE